MPRPSSTSLFFFNDTATTEIYTLSLHDALPISRTLRFTGSPRPVGPQPHHGLRLALPRCGFFQGSAVPGRVGEGDRADRRERDSGIAVGGDVRARGGGVTDGAERVGKRRWHLVVAVEGAHVLAETARLEHRAVEGQRQIARELDAKRRASARHIAGDRERHRGDNLEARERQDRKSTRLNSSHGYISYAVFCLKKKKKQTDR